MQGLTRPLKKTWFEKIILDFKPFFFELDCLHRFKVSFLFKLTFISKSVS